MLKILRKKKEGKKHQWGKDNWEDAKRLWAIMMLSATAAICLLMLGIFFYVNVTL